MWTLADERCTGCGTCARVCPAEAIEIEEGTPRLARPGSCTHCGVCADQCPVGAILVERVDVGVEDEAPTAAALPELVEATEKLRSLLDLRQRPVGVKLIADGDDLPTDVPKLSAPLRHCQAIHVAGQGKLLLIPTQKQACFAARAALGMASLPARVASGEVPYLHGLASSREVAARIMAEVPKLSPGSIRAEVVGALDRLSIDPDVVVLMVTPLQAMWIANAFLYDRGGPRIVANFAGMQASCGDATVTPYKTGQVNFSVGCYGCRSAGGLTPDEIYVGVPSRELPRLVGNLFGLRRAMVKFRSDER